MIFQTSFYKSKKILLIEDCEPVRASIKGMLQQIGFDDITAVADATLATTAARRNAFDFIVADFQLGDGKDALQLLAELMHGNILKAGCCFILMSAEPQRLPVLGLLQGAPDSFVLKPFSYVELEKRLARAWQSRSALRKVYLAIQQQQLSLAQTELDDAIKANPAYTLLALRLKAEILLAQREYSAAEQLYSTIQQQRDFSWARLGQAVALTMSAQWASAEAALQILAVQDDTRAEALLWLSQLYLMQRHSEQAQETLAELLRLQPNNVIAHHAMAWSYQLAGQLDDAVKYWQKLIQQYRFSGFDRAEYYLQLCRLQLQQAYQADINSFSDCVKKAQESLSAMPLKLQTADIETPIALLKQRIAVFLGNIADVRQYADSIAAQPPTLLSMAASTDQSRLWLALGELKHAELSLDAVKQWQDARPDLWSGCQRLLAEQALNEEASLRQKIRDWNKTGMADAQAGNIKAALMKLRQAFLYMPCNVALALNLLQMLSQLPAHKALKPLVRAVLSALENSSVSSANQQKFDELRSALPPLYLD